MSSCMTNEAAATLRSGHYCVLRRLLEEETDLGSVHPKAFLDRLYLLFACWCNDDGLSPQIIMTNCWVIELNYSNLLCQECNFANENFKLQCVTFSKKSKRLYIAVLRRRLFSRLLDSLAACAFESFFWVRLALLTNQRGIISAHLLRFVVFLFIVISFHYQKNRPEHSRLICLNLADDTLVPVH